MCKPVNSQMNQFQECLPCFSLRHVMLQVTADINGVPSIKRGSWACLDLPALCPYDVTVSVTMVTVSFPLAILHVLFVHRIITHHFAGIIHNKNMHSQLSWWYAHIGFHSDVHPSIDSIPVYMLWCIFCVLFQCNLTDSWGRKW